MEVEYTARQVKISKALRTQAEEGMERIARILGKSARASIVFSAQKRLQIVEVTIQARLHTIVAAGKAATLESALRQAIEHAETRRAATGTGEWRSNAAQGGEGAHRASGSPAQGPRCPAVAVSTLRRNQPSAQSPRGHRRALLPARKAVVEPHIVTSGEAFALKPMTIEEAVKDAEFRDRDLLVFHNLAGELFVLHRRRDGQLELVEIP
jgi:putative sigma-54 modulation protein